MSNSKRRRSDVEFLELRNIIESPPTDLDADQNIRKSKRLRRDSICLSNSENKEPSKPSRAPKRKSSRCPLKQIFSPVFAWNLPHLVCKEHRKNLIFHPFYPAYGMVPCIFFD
uniref:Tantalus domain-containing protein n=1 Tax=Schistosoma mansoni TaxID=6183 RepID=A0A5K4ERA7_SCHMA